MKLAILTVSMLTLAAAATSVTAHGPMTGFWGGQMAAVGDWHVEFAVRDGAIHVWVRDHGEKVVNAAGKATLLAGGQRHDVALHADADSLTGKVPVTPADKLTAVLSLTVGGKPAAVRFAQEALVRPALSPDSVKGEEAFKKVCAECHGAALRGTDAGPPLLHPLYLATAGHGDDVILAAIAGGAKAHHWRFGDMAKPEGVPPGTEAAILAYIRAMQAANGFGRPASPGPQAPSASGHSGH